MVNCSISGKKLGRSDKAYTAKGLIICLDCNSCSICGSKPTGEPRPMIDTQPFCIKHFEEAQVEMAKPIEEWRDVFVEAKLNHLKKRRSQLIELQSKSLQRGKFDVFASIFGSQTMNLRADVVRGQRYQQYKDTVESIDKQIASLERVLNPSEETKANLSTTSQDPIMILKLRFAKGEITKDEYEEMLKTLTDRV